MNELPSAPGSGDLHETRSRWFLRPRDLGLTLQDANSDGRSLSFDEFHGWLDLSEVELLGSRLGIQCRVVDLAPGCRPLQVGYRGEVVCIDADGGFCLEGRLRMGDAVTTGGLVLHLGRFHGRGESEHLELEVSGNVPLASGGAIRVEGFLDASRPLRTA